MRLWTLHPKYLDRRGLVALWREGLLAQAVLRGKTQGYRSHPQLIRFRGTARPIAAIAEYLREVQKEAARRGYNFDRRKISSSHTSVRIAVSSGQVSYEWQHLCKKLDARDPEWLAAMEPQRLNVHPLFRVVPGPIEKWERT